MIRAIRRNLAGEAGTVSRILKPDFKFRFRKTNFPRIVLRCGNIPREEIHFIVFVRCYQQRDRMLVKEFLLFIFIKVCKHCAVLHTPPDHTCRHSRPGDCLTPFFSRFRGRFLLRLSFFISFLHNESGDVRSSISPDRCYLLLHGNMLARSALFQVEKRCAANSGRRKPEQ